MEGIACAALMVEVENVAEAVILKGGRVNVDIRGAVAAQTREDVARFIRLRTRVCKVPRLVAYGQQKTITRILPERPSSWN